MNQIKNIYPSDVNDKFLDYLRNTFLFIFQSNFLYILFQYMGIDFIKINQNLRKKCKKD